MADDDTDKKWWKDKEKLVPGLIGAAVRATPPLPRARRPRAIATRKTPFPATRAERGPPRRRGDARWSPGPRASFARRFWKRAPGRLTRRPPSPPRPRRSPRPPSAAPCSSPRRTRTRTSEGRARIRRGFPGRAPPRSRKRAFPKTSRTKTRRTTRVGDPSRAPTRERRRLEKDALSNDAAPPAASLP